jgi:hypothetical protein
MSTIGGGALSFLEAQEEKPAARTTAARRIKVDFIEF